MVFEKGNQLAKGNPNSGIDKKHDREDYAAKLLEWAKKASSLNIVGFCAEYDLPVEYMSRWSKENDVFRQALMIAKAKLCDRQEHYVIMNRYDWRLHNRQLGYYNAAIREFDREEKAFEYSLKKEVDDKATNITIKPINYSKAVDG